MCRHERLNDWWSSDGRGERQECGRECYEIGTNVNGDRPVAGDGGRWTMQDAYETPFDRYETRFDASEGSVAALDERLDPLGARLDRIEATLDRMEARFARFERTFRRLIIGSMVWMTVLIAVFMYVVGSGR
jgi:hypothetical protein